MTLQYAQIDDAVLLTQQNLIKRGAFTDMQTDLSDHVAVREMWKGRVKKFDGGDDWELECQVDHNHSARAVGLFETDGSALTDTMIRGKVQPRHINAHYIYDQREPAFQKGGKSIVDLVNTRYVGMQVSLYELMEEILWSEPADDNKTPFGVGYWVTRTAVEGFTGPNPTNFVAGKAGISQLTQPRWANWNSRYVAISKEDLVRRMRTAHRNIQFRSPVSHPTPDVGTMKNGIYTNTDVIGLMEEILEDQNMNLGNDLDSKGGRTLFKSTPVTYAPYLNSDAGDPVYMLDWKKLAIGVLAGWENQLTAPYMVPGKHLVRRVDLDCTMQMVCTELRRQAVIAKS
ncbi:MAG: phage major capsid protein [Gammaproteobacteria bacterium]|nr:phage major capsid protein [Gammaproteobacteria bacterium]